MRKFITILAFAAAILSTDLHWSVVQTVIWAKMIHQSDSSASFSEKVISTITGEAPCHHCEALAAEQGSERNEILSLLGKGPLLAPLGTSIFRLSHKGLRLFELATVGNPDLPIFATGIDRPPRA
ncbi:MAG: hypothetical protein P1U58_11370 [Verrucomicrobiales bacterium]|nr:hypothetical protein [Verrucomicrobiales bacterium]